MYVLKQSASKFQASNLSKTVLKNGLDSVNFKQIRGLVASITDMSLKGSMDTSEDVNLIFL